MKAIETKGFFDKTGKLQLLEPTNLKDQQVKIIILVPDTSSKENEWYKNAIQSPSFAFLNSEAEDIYTLEDGKALQE